MSRAARRRRDPVVLTSESERAREGNKSKCSFETRESVGWKDMTSKWLFDEKLISIDLAFLHRSRSLSLRLSPLRSTTNKYNQISFCLDKNQSQRHFIGRGISAASEILHISTVRLIACKKRESQYFTCTSTSTTRWDAPPIDLQHVNTHRCCCSLNTRVQND